MENVIFKVKFNQGPQTSWVVYSVHSQAGDMYFMGVCNISSVMNIPDARKHPRFASFFQDVEELTVKIHQTFRTKPDANMWRVWYLSNTHPRPIMMRYLSSYRGKVAVKCLDTGEVFESLKECASAHGINASNLCKHINGDNYHQTVGGRRYEYAKYHLSDRGVYTPY